jgi:hypothetical protein
VGELDDIVAVEAKRGVLHGTQAVVAAIGKAKATAVHVNVVGHRCG